ncbi:MAG: TVP38/TMEM64 family protein [Acetobacteraceae bacterium]|nr:TVP38/TMEM64 family protein [Acetobacteraceae bacterium]
MTKTPATPWQSIWRLSLLLLGLLGAGLALQQLAGGLETAVIDRLVINQGAWGMAVFVMLGGVACASGVPRQAAGFTAGYIFADEFGLGGLTLFLALVLATLAQLLGCALDFFWARLVARNWARARLRGRLAGLERVLCGHPFTITLIIRLLPVGNNTAFSLLGGASSVAAGPFLAASGLGYLPQTIVFVLLGGGARVASWQRIALAGGLFAASVVLGLWLHQRHRATA